MARIVFENMGRYGIIKDRLAHTLPLEAWSDGANVRFYEGSVQRMLGHATVWTPTFDPYWLMSVQTEAQALWVYAGAAAVRTVDQGGVDTDITRASGPYTASFPIGWNGGIFNGLPILNNGVDIPQVWNPPDASTDLVDLPNWPATYRARVIRPFREFLVALDITKAGTRYPHNILWSHVAQPGAVPSSWDTTDPTKDAGEKPVADTQGFVLDLVPLSKAAILYKQDSAWLMQYVGGSSVMSITPMNKFGGVYSRHCVVPINIKGEKHFVVTKDDVIIHDGMTAQSVITLRMRRWLFQQIDVTHYQRLHCVHNSSRAEVWIVIPFATGQCTRALVWNYVEDKWTIRDLPNVNFIASGPLYPTQAISWDSDAEPWVNDQSAWDDLPYHPSEDKLLMATTGTGRKVFNADNTNLNDGTSFTAFVERVGLAVVAQDREGQPKFDLQSVKLCTEIWPRVDGPVGAQLDCYLGTQKELNQPVTWHGPFPYIIGTHEKVNPLESGKLLGVRFEMKGNYAMRLHGFDMVINEVGGY